MKPNHPFSIPAKALHEFLASHCEWVAKCLSEPHRSWVPSITVLAKEYPDSEEQVMVFVLAGVPFNEHEEKHAVLRFVGKQVYETRRFPVAAAMSTEAWFSEQRLAGPRMQPRDDPMRKEMIVIAGTTLGGQHHAMTHFPVTRSPDEMIVLGEQGPLTTRCEARLLLSLFDGFLLEAQKYGNLMN